MLSRVHFAFLDKLVRVVFLEDEAHHATPM